MTEHTYSRPGGMTPHELEKIRRRLGGKTTPNASGARQEAPAILAGSEPSRELKAPEPTPEEIEAIAQANRKARELEKQILAGKPQPGLAPDPVNGEVDPLDKVHEAVLDDETDMEALRRMASAGGPLIPADGSKPESDSLLD